MADDEESRPGGHVIAVGDAFDGIALYGDEEGMPFPDASVATEEAERRFRHQTWNVVPVAPLPD